MFSETRYALNGDLGVAYRASREGARDIVYVANWLTCCEVLPELPSIQGWVEAMTSLGRLVFFDQPGTGASDPVTPGALPTLEQWADSITAVLDDLGSREAVLLASNAAFKTAALFAATHPSRTTALVVVDGYADASGTPLVQDDTRAGLVRMWGSGKVQHLANPDMPWNEEIRAIWARMERLALSPRTLALILPLTSGMDVRAVLPTIRVPTLVVHHTDNAFIPPAKGKYIAEHIPDAKYVELPGRNWFNPLNRDGARPSRRSPSSSPATRLRSPMIGFSPQCSSPTSWTRRAGPPRSATVTGMPCSTHTTPSSGRNSFAFEAAR